jgi:hypothetical protein
LITKHAVFSCSSNCSALTDGLSQINPITVHVFVQLSVQNTSVHKVDNEFGKLTHVNAEFANAEFPIYLTLFHNVNVCKCILFMNALLSIPVTESGITNHVICVPEKLAAHIYSRFHKSTVSIHVQPGNTQTSKVFNHVQIFSVFNFVLSANVQFHIDITESGITNHVICVFWKFPQYIFSSSHKSTYSIHVQFQNTELFKVFNHVQILIVLSFLFDRKALEDIDITESGITNHVICVP